MTVTHHYGGVVHRHGSGHDLDDLLRLAGGERAIAHVPYQEHGAEEHKCHEEIHLRGRPRPLGLARKEAPHVPVHETQREVLENHNRGIGDDVQKPADQMAAEICRRAVRECGARREERRVNS